MTTAEAAPSGVIFNIQRFSTEDGPGLRTTAFLKGCPLRCLWCHNPEGLSSKPDLVWYDVKCRENGDCVMSCPRGVLSRGAGGLRVDRLSCHACGICARACVNGALEVIGRELTSAELAGELLRDAEFFSASGGGVTFSGGEALAQPEFLLDAATRVRAAGVHVAVDTSGLAPKSVFRRAIEAVDLVLYDIKVIDASRHKAATGADNRLILENARVLGSSGQPFWVRFPVIPGFTDDDENVKAVSEFVSREMPGAERVDFVAYNNLCEADYRRLGLPFALEGRGLMSRAEMDRVLAVARGTGLDPKVSGPLAD